MPVAAIRPAGSLTSLETVLTTSLSFLKPPRVRAAESCPQVATNRSGGGGDVVPAAVTRRRRCIMADVCSHHRLPSTLFPLPTKQQQRRHACLPPPLHLPEPQAPPRRGFARRWPKNEDKIEICLPSGGLCRKEGRRVASNYPVCLTRRTRPNQIWRPSQIERGSLGRELIK
jgi:hypothetical protein